MKNTNTIYALLSKGALSVAACTLLSSSAWAVVPTYSGVVTNLTNTDPGITNIAKSGSATLISSMGIVNQTTANAIIEWGHFNVASGETIMFSGGNATLNRVLDVNPSTIAGTVTGDHALFFINPNGIIVTGSMSAPTIVLSTLGISDSDFNAGNYKFTRGSATGNISNSGTISDGGVSGNIGVAALFAANVSNTGTIRSNNVAIVAADAVTLGATTSNSADGAYNPTANGYTGVSAITASTVATSVSNTNSIYAVSSNGNAGDIDIYSTKGTISNDGANIGSYNYYGGTGDVTVHASGDITNVGGSINSNSDSYGVSGSSGAVRVISDTGSIDNSYGSIYSYSYYGASGDVTVRAHGDIINTNGDIYSEADGYGSSSGEVSVVSDTGSIDSSNGEIYSQSQSGVSGDVTVQAKGDVIDKDGGRIYSVGYGNGYSSGDVRVISDTGTIDLTNDGEVYSYYSNGSSGDVYLTASALLYTKYAGSAYDMHADDLPAPSCIQSQSYNNEESLQNGTIHIQADTINGAAVSTLTASDFEKTTDSEGGHNVWFGNLTFGALTVVTPTPTVTVQQATVHEVEKVSQSTQMLASNSGDTGRNQGFSPKPETTEKPNAADSFKTDTAPDEKKTGAASFENGVSFTVGHDITGAGNAFASSTIIPGVFILND